MIIHEMAQGSPEWIAIRLGKPTASQFHRIITPKQRKLSAAAGGYANELLAERWLGQPIHPVDPMSKWENALGSADMYASFTARGTELEEEAVAYYEAVREVDVRRVGFCTIDDGTVGASPDALVGDEGGLEIQCRGASHHVNLLGSDDEIAKDTQVQGNIWVTGAKWWDVLAYNPAFPPVLRRYMRDEEFMDALDVGLEQFCKGLERGWEILKAYGPEGRIDGNLRSQLVASLIQGKEPDPQAMTLEEVTSFCDIARKSLGLGIIDLADYDQMVDDVVAGRWQDTRSMWTYLKRELEAAT